MIEQSVGAWAKSGSRKPTSTRLVHRESQVCRRSEAVPISPPPPIQIDMAALPLHKSQPILPSGPGLDGSQSRLVDRYPVPQVPLPPGPQIVTFPDAVGRYPDPVGRYPGPRRPGDRSVAIPIMSAATPVHAVPEIGRSLSRYRRPLPIPTVTTCDSEHFTVGSRVVAAIRCCCWCCLPL